VMSTQTERLGGTEGNEILTSATAVVLTLLLIAEGVTIVLIGDMLSAHLFIGMALIPPVLLKLGSTGYRFARYYTGARIYREPNQFSSHTSAMIRSRLTTRPASRTSSASRSNSFGESSSSSSLATPCARRRRR
jgi:hypothetical protein